MEKNNLKNGLIKDKISRREDVRELNVKIIPEVKTLKECWACEFKEILKKSGYTKTKFAEKCQVSRMSVNNWCKGVIPKSRETFLRIGMIVNYNLEEVNQLLQRYGRYPALYSKTLEDCICIFVLNNNLGKDKIDSYFYILNRIKQNIIRNEEVELYDVTTVRFDEKLSKIEDESALEQFINENIAAFANTYNRLYAYIKMHINSNYPKHASSIFDMAQAQGWSSSLRQCVSKIYQNKWYPTRNKIISLGLHLSMDHSQIDEMLELAHMGPLSNDNVLERVIIFILDDAKCNNMLDTDSEEFDPDELCKYARDVLSQLELPEIQPFISELSGIDDDAW